MSADVDKLIRAILIQAMTAKDLASHIALLKAVAGEDNVGIVLKTIAELESK
jgi:hypothetical protein